MVFALAKPLVARLFLPLLRTKGMKKAAFLFFRVEVGNAACAVQYLVVVQTMLVRCPKNLDFTVFQKVSLSNLIFHPIGFSGLQKLP